VHTDDGRILTLPRRQERCLFGILLLEAGRTVALSRLADLLWDDPPLKAPQAVRTYVARIRALLAQVTADVTLASDHGGYRIYADPDLVDASTFRRLVRESTGRPASGRCCSVTRSRCGADRFSRTPPATSCASACAPS